MIRRELKRVLVWFFCLFLLILLRCPSPQELAYGAAKINKVNIKIEADGFDMEGEPVLDVHEKSNRYTVNELDTAWHYYGEDQGYREEDNIYIIELGAADGYYFSITNAAGIHLNGAGAEFVKALRKDNGQTLLITAKLTRLSEFLADVSGASWLTDGFASWEAAHGAYLYKVVLTDQKGRKKRAETGGIRYDFSPYLLVPGTYDYQVQGVSESGQTGRWCYGGSYTVSEEEAAANASQYKVEVECIYKDDIKTPDNCIKSYRNIGWQKEEERFWYRDEDGAYPQSVWRQIGESWYYFHSDGYMAQDEYISWAEEEYYVGEDGKMATNIVTPDGRKADADGELL